MGRLPPALQRFLELPPAERRIGPFVLDRQLGRGGFAPVWLAREVYGDTELRTAAVKLFALEGSSDARARVVAEARALCRVEHPNVVRFYTLPIDEARGIMGLAMEHVAGAPLHERIALRGRLRADEAIAVGAAIASALAAVHRAGLVHRDVKPANIVETAGGPKLIDFGIAAADDLGGPRSPHTGPPRRLGNLPATAAGTRLLDLEATAPLGTGDAGGVTLGFGMATGTVGYIDPAIIADGERATAASDLYGLGATLFQCLAGRVPAAADTGRLLGGVLDGRAAAPSLRAVAKDTPEPLARLVDALLAPSRRDRPASAEDVAAALERLRADHGPRAMPHGPAGPSRGLALAAAVSLLAAAAGGAAYLRAARSDAEAAPWTRDAGDAARAPDVEAQHRTLAEQQAKAQRDAEQQAKAQSDAEPPVDAYREAEQPVDAQREPRPPVKQEPDAERRDAGQVPPGAAPLPEVIAVSRAAPSPPLLVRAGRTPTGEWLPEISVLRLPGDEGQRWSAAMDRCRDRGLALCTEAQWSRACEVEPALAATETWTGSPEADRGFAVRGGAGEGARRIVRGSDASAARGGLCCTRAAALRAIDVDEARFPEMERRLLAWEAAQREGSASLAALLADSLRFYTRPAWPRRSVVAAVDSLLARTPDFWALLDTCDVSADAALGTWTADCLKTARQSGAIAFVVSRVVWSRGEGKIVAVYDTEVRRAFSAP